ncbi:MAG: hypothetical protein ACJAW3_001403 [Lentimonas sp.]|jgi:hypothetical protein
MPDKTTLFSEDIGADGKITDEALRKISTSLDLRSCGVWLKPTPELIEQLEILEIKGVDFGDFVLYWPIHFGRNERVTTAKKRLNELAFNRKIPDGETPNNKAPNTILMLNRYMDELSKYYKFNKDYRDVDEIANEVEILLDMVASNPSHLGWIEEMATTYTSGCVNQPVTGFAMIGAWVKIAQETNVMKKIAAAKQLMVMDVIANFVGYLNIPNSIEAEAFNILFREVHKHLLKNRKITDSWLGVQKQIHSEEVVKKICNKKIIRQACAQADKMMRTPPRGVKDFLFEKNPENEYKVLKKSELWAKTGFASETAVTEKEAETKKNQLLYSISNLPIGEAEKSTKLHEEYKALEKDTKKKIIKDAAKQTDYVVGGMRPLSWKTLSPQQSCYVIQ